MFTVQAFCWGGGIPAIFGPALLLPALGHPWDVPSLPASFCFWGLGSCLGSLGARLQVDLMVECRLVGWEECCVDVRHIGCQDNFSRECWIPAAQTLLTTSGYTVKIQVINMIQKIQ